MFNRLFHLADNHTTTRTEIVAGITTFLTMAYILVLQPAILARDFAGQPTGMDPQAIFLATCLAASVTTLLMGLYANYPIALAPGMGENFFFVATIMAFAGMGVPDPWKAALGIVLISGVIFLLFSLLPIRRILLEAVSPSLRNGMAVGIGLFIALIGFQHGGLITAKPNIGVGLNIRWLSEPDAIKDILVFFTGLAVAGGLQARKVRGAILWGIGASTLLALGLGRIEYQGIFGFPQVTVPAIGQWDLWNALSWKALPFIAVFCFMDIFDTMGTLVGVSEQAGLIKDNRIPRADRVMLVDACGTVFGACVGTSTVTSYIESAAGVSHGGRTGLTSVVTGILFLVALAFSPLVNMIGSYGPATACALVIVGAMMMHNAVKIDWDDMSEALPAFLIAIGIPFTYSIADGLALGFAAYPVMKILCGRHREVHWILYMMFVIVLAYFALARIHLG